MKKQIKLSLLGSLAIMHSVAMSNSVATMSTPVWLDALEIKTQALINQANAWDASENADLSVQVPKRAIGKGSKGADAQLLCAALAARGFGACDDANDISRLMPEKVKEAQIFYGLQADGLPDTQLYNALALSNREKARLARAAVLDLDSIRANAIDLMVPRAVIVNIPSFSLEAYDEAGLQVSSRVIIGRPGRETPIGKLNVLSLKFNPNWTAPEGIMKKDVYPSLDGDGTWLQKHGLVMFDQDGQKIDIEGVSSAQAKEMGYRFTQPAGDYAALGKLKFETDSKESIYLHDTNERHLFKQAMRAKSSGCVRVQEWTSLAAWMATESPADILNQVNKRATVFKQVSKTPVYIGYRLADVVNGKVVIFPNIYRIAQTTAPLTAEPLKEPAAAVVPALTPAPATNLTQPLPLFNFALKSNNACSYMPNSALPRCKNFN